MLGFIIAFWATPDMTLGHLLFAFGTSAYILIGIRFEERDMREFLGPDYDSYREEVPMLCPFHFGRKKATGTAGTSGSPNVMDSGTN